MKKMIYENLDKIYCVTVFFRHKNFQFCKLQPITKNYMVLKLKL